LQGRRFESNVTGGAKLTELDLHQVMGNFFITKYKLAENRQLYYFAVVGLSLLSGRNL
jgi:hypothetical protein